MKTSVLVNSFFSLLFIFSLLLLFIFLKYQIKYPDRLGYINKEKFAWNCTWTPNVNYYKENWLLGDLSRIADGNIKQPYYN